MSIKSAGAKGIHPAWISLEAPPPSDTLVCEEHDRSFLLPAGEVRDSGLLFVACGCSCIRDSAKEEGVRPATVWDGVCTVKSKAAEDLVASEQQADVVIYKAPGRC